MMTGLGVVYQIGIWERRLIRGMHWPSEHGLKAVSCCKESRVSRLSRSGCYKACPFSWSGDGTGSQGTTIWIWQTNGEAEPLYSQKRGGFSSPLGTTTPEATIAGLLSRPLLNKSTCLLVPQVSLWCKNRTENDRLRLSLPLPGDTLRCMAMWDGANIAAPCRLHNSTLLGMCIFS